MPCVWTVFDSWMDERDPDFVPTAVAMIDLALRPPPAGPTFGVAEKTGSGVREPPAPRPPVAPGQPARREFEYGRHGTAAVLAAFAVPTGPVHGLGRPRHRAAEFSALRRLLDQQGPPKEVIPLLLAPLRLQGAAEGAV
jgi:hypothetical protein